MQVNITLRKIENPKPWIDSVYAAAVVSRKESETLMTLHVRRHISQGIVMEREENDGQDV